MVYDSEFSAYVSSFPDKYKVIRTWTAVCGFAIVISAFLCLYIVSQLQ